MKKIDRIQVIVVLLGLGGAALFVSLIREHGFAETIKAVQSAKWAVFAVVAYHLIPIMIDGIAWRALFPPVERLSVIKCFWMRWMGEAVSTLLPAAQVGGDIVRARLAAIHGVRVPVAAASVLVDITLSILAQAIFTVSGLGLLAMATNRISALQIFAGGAIALLAIGGFYFVQRIGIFKLIGLISSKLAGDNSWLTFVRNAQALDRDVHAMYDRRSGIVLSFCSTFASWVIGAGEVYIVMKAMNLPGGFRNAFILESVGQGLRAAMFLVPGALGIQEEGYIQVGALLGLSGEAALALALIRRVRELSIGVPGLLAWQIFETRRMLRQSPSPAAENSN